MTRWTRWAVTGAVLAATCVPVFVRAEEPATRPAAAERRGKPEAGRRQGPPPGQMIDQFRTIAKELNLTDEQKTKVEAALKTAAEEFKEVRSELESMEPRDRRERVEAIFSKMRQGVHDALTEEQRQTLRKRMAELRPGGQRPGGEGTGPTTRPGPLIERLQQNIEKLGLSDDQKTKVQSVLADAKAQMAELREGLVAGDEAAREKVGALMLDVRRQVGEILTPEQRDKLREIMAPPPGDGPPPPGGERRRDARRGGDEMMGEEMTGEMRPGTPPRPGERPRQRPPRDQRRPRGPTTGPAPGSGATLGSAAPAFELTKLDGKPVRLSTLQGRVGVIVFGSYSCPSFRQRAAAIEALAKQFGSRAQFLIVYTKEAHPAGEWDVERNKDEGISVEAHQDAAARAAQATKAKEALGLSIPIAPDTMDDAVSAAFGGFPNGAVVLSRDGTIVARQQWVDPSGLERRIEQALKIPTSKPS